MHLEKLLELLVDDLKLGAIPQKDKDDIHQLKLLPDLQIGVSELDPGIFFSSLLLPIPKEGGKEALYIHLMKANLLGQGTGGGSIGIDSTEKYLTFSLTLSFEVSYTIFKESLEDFVNYVSYWSEEVLRFNQTLL